MTRWLPILLASFSLAAQAPPAAQPKAAPARQSAKPAPRAAAAECMSREQGEKILQELQEIRALLEKMEKAPAPAAGGVKIKIAPDDPFLGSKDAPVTIVEFTDYECGFCRRFHATVFPALKKDFIDTGKLRFYSRDFPLDMHQNAMKAAAAVRCANEQRRFWPMHEDMLANPGQLTPDVLLKSAEKLGLETLGFRMCLDSGRYDERVRAEIAEAAGIGVEGTPSFVLGKTAPDAVTGQLIVGAQPYPIFEAAIKKLID